MTTLIPKFDLKNGGSTPVGAINRPINEKLQESISVKDFGAVGDGTTDDTTAIQNAIDSVTSTKRTIFLPPGTYKVTAPLVISLEMTIYGTNRVGTYINYYGSGSAITTTADGTPNLSNVYLSGFGLYNLGTGTTGINFSNVQDSRISNVTISGFTLYGVYAVNSYGNLIEHIQSTNSYGVYLGLEANNITLLQCTFLNNTNAGIFISGGRSNNFIGCDFEGNNYGVQVSGAVSGIGTKALNIQGCYFEGNTTYEIIVEKHTALAGLPEQINIKGNYFCGISGKATTAIGVVDVNTLDVFENDFDNQGVAYSYSLTVSGTGTVSNINWGFNKDASVNGTSFVGVTKNNLAQSTATAWGNFSGVTTVTINASYVVSTIVRNSTGNYTVTLNKTLLSANYAVVATASNFSTGVALMCSVGTLTTNSFVISVANPSAVADANVVSFVVFA